MSSVWSTELSVQVAQGCPCTKRWCSALPCAANLSRELSCPPKRPFLCLETELQTINPSLKTFQLSEIPVGGRALRVNTQHRFPSHLQKTALLEGLETGGDL